MELIFARAAFWVIVLSCIGVWLIILSYWGFLIFRKVSKHLLEEVPEKGESG